MDHTFIFEDGKGNQLTEDRLPMDLSTGEDFLELEDLTTMDAYIKVYVTVNWKQEDIDNRPRKSGSRSTHLRKKKVVTEVPETRTYNKYSEETWNLVIAYSLEEVCSAAAVGKHYNVERKTAQRWIK